MGSRIRDFATGLAGAVLLSMPPAAAYAQSGGAAEGPAAQESPATRESLEVTEQKFDAFVDVAVSLLRIREDWQPKVQAADDQAAAEEAAKAARQEMVKAIEDAPGITAQEYVAIARAAEENPQLAQAIEQRVRAAYSKGRPGAN